MQARQARSDPLHGIVIPNSSSALRSDYSIAGFPSILNPASEEMISDSVEVCETELCFLHIQLIGTNG